MGSTGQKLLAVRILPKQTINLNPHLNGQVLISMSLFSGGVGREGEASTEFLLLATA